MYNFSLNENIDEKIQSSLLVYDMMDSKTVKKQM